MKGTVGWWSLEWSIDWIPWWSQDSDNIWNNFTDVERPEILSDFLLWFLASKTTKYLFKKYCSLLSRTTSPSSWAWLTASWASNTGRAPKSQRGSPASRGDGRRTASSWRGRPTPPSRCVVIIPRDAFYISAFYLFVLTSLFLLIQDDYLVSKPVKQHLAKYDIQLKTFNVSKSLDTALAVRISCIL